MKFRFSLLAMAVATCVLSALTMGIVWYFDIPHAAVEKVPGVNDKSIAEVIARFGNPDSDSYFMVDDELGEFQIELYNTYRLGAAGNENVQIRQCTWEYSIYSITVWFHQPDDDWIALDSCRYRNNVQF